MWGNPLLGARLEGFAMGCETALPKECWPQLYFLDIKSSFLEAYINISCGLVPLRVVHSYIPGLCLQTHINVEGFSPL
jgi:hypothetical protein